MSSGYTPGPWHTGGDGRIVYNAAGWAVCNAVTFHQRHQGDEDRANARLIAAAPELLATLEGLERWFDTDQEILDAMSPDERADHERQFGKIRAAIANAKGGAA